MPSVTPIALFKTVFQRLTPGVDMRLAELYADDIVFEDPLHRVNGRAAVAAHFDRLNARIEFAEFTFTDEIVSADRASLSWTMRVQLRRPRLLVTVPGVSVLQFTDRITRHRDYFDVGAMMYEQLPLIGRFLKFVKRATA